MKSLSSIGIRDLIVVVLLAVCVSQAAGLVVQVKLEWGSALAPPHTSVHIQAIEAAGPNAGRVISTDTEDDTAVLNLSEGAWQVQAAAPGYWTQAEQIVVRRQTPTVANFRLWPATTLHGVVVTREGEPLPEAIDIQLNAAPPSDQKQNGQRSLGYFGPPHAELHCRVDAAAWSCPSPAGLYDIKFEESGFAPHYQWGVSLKAGENADFGKLDLLRTTSVVGRVVRKDGSDPPPSCRATLRPNTERRGPGEADQEPNAAGAKTGFSVLPNRRGFFQIIGVAPGKYALAVGCQGASAYQDVRVQANGETRIEPPMVLQELTLNLAVIPKTDPAGQPWRIAAYQTAPHYLLVASGAPVPSDGRWTRPGLMAGNYHIVVSSSDGTTWLQKYFHFKNGSGPLLLRIDSVNVAGRVTMSSEPVRARLVFTNNAGGESRTLMSDEAGRFQGLLPIVSSLQESNWTVEAHVAQPPVTQRLFNVNVRPAGGAGNTWLDLDLPAIPVHGTVVSPDGKPVPGIEIIFEGSTGTRITTGTDETGRFEIADLPMGKYTARADSLDGSSDAIPFEVGEGSSRELKLVLNPFKQYSFSVLSAEGPVENAAVQVWISPGVPRAFVRTDENGRFDVSLPPGTAEVGLTIGAPGYPLKLIRLPISSSDDDSRTVTLDAATGKLILNLQQPGRPPDNSDALYLVHNGALQDARTLVGWGTNQAVANTGEPATVDSIEPGDYALCRVDPAQVGILWSGSPPSSHCHKGSLEQDETLTLSVP